MIKSNCEKGECTYSCGCKLFYDREKESDADFKFKIDCKTFKMQQTIFWQTYTTHYDSVAKLTIRKHFCFRILKMK